MRPYERFNIRMYFVEAVPNNPIDRGCKIRCNLSVFGLRKQMVLTQTRPAGLGVGYPFCAINSRTALFSDVSAYNQPVISAARHTHAGWFCSACLMQPASLHACMCLELSFSPHHSLPNLVNGLAAHRCKVECILRRPI